MLSYRATKVAGDLGAVDKLSTYLGHSPEPLTVAMTGASGTVGAQLRALLMTAGIHGCVLGAPPGADAAGGRERQW